MTPYLDDNLLPAPATKAQPSAGPAVGGDDFDDLFDYDVGLDEVFRDLEPRKPASPKDTSKKGRGDGLGIDKEVEVVKKARAPRVKLDENRLLSQAGIPKLRRKAKDLKFKGKGHEYSDAARLLSFYQLWLDDLFPKARFLDAAAMVEKLGHKKRMQVMRMDWINEGKPKEPVHADDIFDEPVLPPREASSRTEMATRIAPILEGSQNERPKTPEVNANNDEDLYDATPRIPRINAPIPTTESSSIFGPRKTAAPEKPRDDLDALLEEQELDDMIATNELRKTAEYEDPEDDLDALLAEQEMEVMSAAKGAKATTQDRNMSAPEPDYDDDLEAMAEMGDMYDY